MRTPRFLLPAAYGFVYGIPIPQVHDEFAYLLGSDTFASGRLTNLTPLFWQSFESQHILLVPSYMSKYPPLQSLFLAFGQIIFGHPIFGVWVNCGLAAAASCWMMQAWTAQSRALWGTLLMISFIGINSYWAQSYWGGMTTVLGGALLLGAFRRSWRKWEFSSSLLLAIGGSVLLNSRPFEGIIAIFFVLIVLGCKLLRQIKSREAVFTAFKKLLIPGAAVSCITISLMGFYNFRVTGNVLKLPYSVHHEQYFIAPLFIFQKPNSKPIQGHQRIKEFAEYFAIPRLTKLGLHISSPPESIYLFPLYAFLSLLIVIPSFFFSPALFFLFYLLLPVVLRRKRSLRYLAASILVVFGGLSFATFSEHYHYPALLTSCFYLLIIECIYTFIRLFNLKKKRFYTIFAYSAVFTLVSVSFIYLNMSEADVYRYFGNPEVAEINLDAESRSINSPLKAVFYREQINKNAKLSGEKYLILVNYAKEYTFHDEIVYNSSDLEESPVIWAHYLEEEQNKSLTNHYQKRKSYYYQFQIKN